VGAVVGRGEGRRSRGDAGGLRVRSWLRSQ